MRVAEDRATDRLREAAFLGWQVATILGGRKAPTFDKYLGALGLSRRRRTRKSDRRRELQRARMNAARARAAFQTKRKE